MTAYCISVTGLNDSGEPKTFTNIAITSGPRQEVIEGLPPDADSRITQVGNFERHALGTRRVTGRPVIDYGVIQLDSSDGGLDELELLGTDGQEVLILRAPDTESVLANFSTYFKGTVGAAPYANGNISLHIRNRQAEVADLPLSTEKYAGDNALPAGVEGVADDIGGSYKPVWLGLCENVPVPLVNTSRHIFQLSSNDAIAVTGTEPSAVYDSAVEITATKVQKMVWADFIGATGPSGELWWYAGAEGWFIRLEAAPAGTVAVTAQEGGLATTAQLVKRMLVARGVSSGSIAGDTALDAANPETVGYWAGLNEITIGEALGDILEGVVGTWTDDRSGTFTLARLEIPAETPDHIFYRDQINREGGEGFRIVATEEPGSPVPVSEVSVFYRKAWHTQTGDELDVNAPESQKAFVAKEYRQSRTDNSGVLVKHITAAPHEHRSLFTNKTDADTAGARLVALFGVRRFIVEIDLSTEDAATVLLFQTISIPIGRFDFDTRNFRVIGIVDVLDTQTAASKTTLILWG